MLLDTAKKTSRREFGKTVARGALASSALATGATSTGFPAIVPASVFSPTSPSNRINVGAIGVGRISRIHDLPGIWQFDTARVMTVCDLDASRAESGRALVNGYYARKSGTNYSGVTVYTDYRELLANKDVDAVVVSTPDHWHAIIAFHAVQAGKDVYVQKPASLTIAEGRALSDAVHRSGRIVQIGSQQRSWEQFRFAAEVVRNGRLGQLKTVKIGLPVDPAGNVEPQMPVPAKLNYDMWLGSTPEVFYTEKRVHPQADFGRPGWLRCRQFGAGMITGWGSHHIDCAHWAMDTEYTGPVEVNGTAEFPTHGLWDVHGKFHTEGLYANGVRMVLSDDYPNGIRFEGTEGWLFVCRGDVMATPSDPPSSSAGSQKLVASDPKLLTTVIGPDEIHLYVSNDHHGNWLECVRTRQQPIAPVEVGHRSCSACLVHHTSMLLKRKLYWDPARERFKNDDEANATLSRPQRVPYRIDSMEWAQARPPAGGGANAGAAPGSER